MFDFPKPEAPYLPTLDEPPPEELKWGEIGGAVLSTDETTVIPPLSEKKPGQVLKWVDP